MNFKTIIIVIILIVAGFFGWRYFNPAETATNDALAVEKSTTATVPQSNKILIMLQKMEKVSLDLSVLSDQAFLSLVDNTASIEAVDLGRLDPFAPLWKQESASLTAPAPATKKTTGTSTKAPAGDFGLPSM